MDEIAKLRKDIRLKVINELSEKQKEMVSKQKFPYEGMWLTFFQIEKLQKKLKVNDKIILIEILLLYASTLYFSYMILKFLMKFLLPWSHEFDRAFFDTNILYDKIPWLLNKMGEIVKSTVF